MEPLTLFNDGLKNKKNQVLEKKNVILSEMQDLCKKLFKKNPVWQIKKKSHGPFIFIFLFLTNKNRSYHNFALWRQIEHKNHRPIKSICNFEILNNRSINCFLRRKLMQRQNFFLFFKKSSIKRRSL